jgi:hypothetical protein
MTNTPAEDDPKGPRALRIVGEVLSQLLNVPILSGALVVLAFFRTPADAPNRVAGLWWALLFISLIPLCSLFFYIPAGTKEWPKVVKRQRLASFVLMIVSYPIGWIVLRLTDAPRIYQAIAASYSLITLGLIVFNLILRYKASGHAAGVAGPVAAALYSFGWIALPLLSLIPLTIFARMAAKGHRFWELVVGAAMSICITVAVLGLYGFSPLGHFQ